MIHSSLGGDRAGTGDGSRTFGLGIEILSHGLGIDGVDVVGSGPSQALRWGLFGETGGQRRLGCLPW